MRIKETVVGRETYREKLDNNGEKSVTLTEREMRGEKSGAQIQWYKKREKKKKTKKYNDRNIDR